jgi:membrane fusion protein (multidrug efflux system)
MSYTKQPANPSRNGRGAAYLEPESSPQTQSPASQAVETEVAKPEVAPEDLNGRVQDPQEPSPKPPRKGRKGLILALLGVGAIAASGFGYRWFQYSSTHQETDNATVVGHLYPVSSRITGRVSEVTVNDNQLVHKGQLLVHLDPHDYQVKVQQAQAALLVARRQAQAAQTTIAYASTNAQAQTTQAQGNITGAIASIADAQAAVEAARAGVPAAQADLAQANANLEKTQADYARYTSLYQSGAIAAQQLDAARAAYNVSLAQQRSAQEGVQQAQAKLVQAQQGVSAAQAKLASTQGQLQEAQATGVQTQVNRSQYDAAVATIAQAQANLKEAQLQLSYTNITAPTDGRVGNKNVEVGQQVQPGQPLLAVVGNDFWVVANYKETQLKKMQPGEMADIHIDAFPDHTFRGRIDSLSPASGADFALLPPDNATGNFTKVVQRIPVKIVFDPASLQGYEGRITPGMSAVISVDVRDH